MVVEYDNASQQLNVIVYNCIFIGIKIPKI